MALTYEFGSVDTLMTQQEVVDHAPVDPNSYADQRLPFIAMREEKLFRKCLGITFYKTLMADRVIYRMVSGTGVTVYVNFKEGTSYLINAVVLYKNRLYKAKAATSGTQIPTDESYWMIAPKFVSDDHNYLWERYLRTILAFSISNDSLFYRLVSDTAQGLVQKEEEGKFKAVAIKDAGRLRQEYQTNIDDLMETMHEFMKENKDLYPDYAPLTDDCVNCNINKPRHYGFNTRRRNTSLR
jgi:hypothetical protein